MALRGRSNCASRVPEAEADSAKQPKKTATRKDSGLIMYQPQGARECLSVRISQRQRRKRHLSIGDTVGLFEGEDEAADHVAINKELGSVHSFLQDLFYRPIKGAADGFTFVIKVALERIRLPTAFKSEGMVF